MSTTWAIILVMAVGTFVTKAAGPLILGGRTVPARVERVIVLTVPVMLAAVIVHQTFTANGDYVMDARVLGLGAAAAGLLLKLPLPVILVAAAGTTAAARALA